MDPSYRRVCDYELQSLGYSFDIGQVPYIADAALRMRVYRADAIRQAIADIEAGNWLYAFRGLLYIKSAHGQCGGYAHPELSDAITALQVTIEDRLRSQGLDNAR